MNTVVYAQQSLTPSKIICIGRNYVAHAEELGNAIPAEPVIFIKPNSAISNQLYAGREEARHYEGEICFLVIKGQLAGVGFGLDVTKRKTQQRLAKVGLPWERAKAFDGAAVLSYFVNLDNTDVEELAIALLINGEVVQQGSVGMMLFKPRAILEELTRFISLEDGDIIMTGTPAGAGPIAAGDCFEGRITAGNKTLVNIAWQAIQGNPSNDR